MGWRFYCWSLILGCFLIAGVYLGGVIVMWNYAMPMIYKAERPYSEYKRWKKEGFEERAVVSMTWPLFVFEREIPYDYDRKINDPNP